MCGKGEGLRYQKAARQDNGNVKTGWAIPFPRFFVFVVIHWKVDKVSVLCSNRWNGRILLVRIRVDMNEDEKSIAVVR